MRQLSGFDALFVYDDGPRETQHTIKVCFLSEEASRAYDFESAKAHVGTRLVMMPPLRWQVARIPFDLHHPVWIEAESIDLDHHVRCRRLPDAAGREELCRAISGIANGALDPARPLWETWFLEGYEGNKVVIVLKVSHALADGGSFVGLFEHAMFAQPTEPEVAERIERAIAAAMPRMESRPGRVKLFCLGVGGCRETFSPACPGCWQRRCARAGALRNYLQERAALPDAPLVASMSASIRRPDERDAWDNRVTTRALRLPTHLADPLERLRYAHREADEVKRDVALHAGAQFVDWVELAPPFIVKAGSWLMRRVVGRMQPPGAVIVSNVRGPASPLYTTHGPVENLVSVGNVRVAPAINITVWSYVEKLNFGLYTYDAFPDLTRVADHLEQAVAELADAAQRVGSGSRCEEGVSSAPRAG